MRHRRGCGAGAADRPGGTLNAGRAAVLPHPPLLVPEVASGAAGELDELRAACHKAIDAVVASDVDRLVVVGGGPRRASFGPGARGSLVRFRRPRRGRGARCGAWRSAGPAAVRHDRLLAAEPSAICRAQSRSRSVAAETSSPDAAAVGAALAASAARVGLLVMGDGSATLTPKAPGYVVEGAGRWQGGCRPDARLCGRRGSWQRCRPTTRTGSARRDERRGRCWQERHVDLLGGERCSRPRRRTASGTPSPRGSGWPQ